MSSLVRTIQRTVKRKCKAPYYMGRGSQLGYCNPKEPKPHGGSRKRMNALDARNAAA